MRRLGNVVARLNSAARNMDAVNANDEGRLAVLNDFGSNPGNLDARIYLPADSPQALVVVLHGCTQSALVYDKGSGWSKLAEKEGFAVLFPQQRRTNNPNLCFNWYQPSDARRGCGEAASISQMTQRVAAEYGLDRSRVFITGLSAGGAMTSVMLATYPEMFAGGAIIAGLPYASANSLPEALERMRGQAFPSRRALFTRSKAAADTSVEPPTLAVWHGTNDAIVDPANASATVNQWLDLHGCAHSTSRVENVAGHRREIWSDSGGRTVVERYDMRGLGHGTPIDTSDPEACGSTGPHMLQSSICSTRKIAGSWGLLGEGAIPSALPRSPSEVESLRPHYQLRSCSEADPQDVGTVIEKALRAAGLIP